MQNKVHSLLTGAFEQREIVLYSGEQISLGANPNLFQTVKVIAGIGIMTLDNDEIPIQTDNLIQISPGSSARFQATGNFALELFITSSGHI